MSNERGGLRTGEIKQIILLWVGEIYPVFSADLFNHESSPLPIYKHPRNGFLKTAQKYRAIKSQ